MERLTNEYWRNFDPWECCGQDKYCNRGCHEQGGCNNGCIVPKIYARLGRYEDTDFEPGEALELAEAKKAGRLVVLDEKTLLALSAGARAIENNKRLFGAKYCWNVFGVNGEPREISYYEAANILRQISEPLLDREKSETATEELKGE